uniref:RING-type domain-containing protein n=1 Tax=Sinocyclocheilus grahami TaxID=75366 RepID=A0A672QNF0_SINGR
MSLLYEDIVKFVANNLKCSICMEIFTKPVTLVCGHNYCQKCINACWAKSSARRDCPHCRADVSSSKLEMNFTLCDILELQDLGGRETWESTKNVFVCMCTVLCLGKHYITINKSTPLSTTPKNDRHLFKGVLLSGLHAEFVELSFSPQLGNKRLVFHTESHRVETQPGNQARTLHGRFDACQWMAEQEFRGEWVYWDVDTTFSTGWAVGVANPSLKRSERLGRTPSSWCLEWSSGQLSAWHNNIKTSVKHSIPNGIRVILDMPKGQLSFQSLRDSLLELHSFQVDSSGPFIPIFWLYGLSHNALTFPRH